MNVQKVLEGLGPEDRLKVLTKVGELAQRDRALPLTRRGHVGHLHLGKIRQSAADIVTAADACAKTLGSGDDAALGAINEARVTDAGGDSVGEEARIPTTLDDPELQHAKAVGSEFTKTAYETAGVITRRLTLGDAFNKAAARALLPNAGVRFMSEIAGKGDGIAKASIPAYDTDLKSSLGF